MKKGLWSLAFSFLLVLTCVSTPLSAQPAATEEELVVRKLLSGADQVQVRIFSVGIDEAGSGVEVIEKVTTVPVNGLRSVVGDLKLEAHKNHSWGTGIQPSLFLDFFKKGKKLGSLSIGYGGGEPYDFWGPIINGDREDYKHRRDLQKATVFRLRQWVSGRPQITKSLKKRGASPEALKPNFHYPPARKR